MAFRTSRTPRRHRSDTPRRSLASALPGITLAALLFGLEISSVPTILPTVSDELGGTFAGLQWVINAYIIAVATMVLPIGAIADRVGRRRVLLISVAGFGAASLLCGLASSVDSLIAARALQGLTGGAMLISQVAVLSHQFTPPRERARAFGLWGVLFGAGLGFGPIIGAVLADVGGWRSVFLAPAAVAVVAWLLVRHEAVESRDEAASRIDLVGTSTFAGAILAFTIGTTRLPEPGWATGGGIAAGLVALMLLIAFLVVQRRSAHPMVPLGLLRNRALIGALCGSVGMNTSFWPFVVFVPMYLERSAGMALLVVGVLLLTLTLPPLLVPPLAERVALRVGPAVLIPAGLALIGAGLLITALTVHLDVVERVGIPALLPGLLVAGTGLGFTNTPVTNTATSAVAPRWAGVASGVDMSARMVTLAGSVGLLGLMLLLGIRASTPGLEGAAFEVAQQVVEGRRTEPEALAVGFSLIAAASAASALLAAAASWLVFHWPGRDATTSREA